MTSGLVGYLSSPFSPCFYVFSFVFYILWGKVWAWAAGAVNIFVLPPVCFYSGCIV